MFFVHTFHVGFKFKYFYSVQQYTNETVQLVSENIFRNLQGAEASRTTVNWYQGHPEFPVNPKISENLKVLAVEVSSES